MSFAPVGIHDLALAVPRNRILLADLCAYRSAQDPGMEERLARALATTGQKAMRYPSVTEDTVTLAAEAVAALLDSRSDLPLAHLRYLTLGTETGVDMSKAGSSYVLGLLQNSGYPLPLTLASFQVQQACVGGTLGLLSVAGLVQTGQEKDAGLVLTSDIARYKAPSTAEITQGAGASALWVSRNPGLLELDLATVGLASRDVDDFFRPLGSTIAQVKGRYSQSCYHESLVDAFEDHCRRAGVSPADELDSIDAFFTHVPYATLPVTALEHLLAAHKGLDASGAHAFLADRGFFASLEASSQIGNLYTGSLYLSLAFGLTERIRAWGPAAVGKKVLLTSYGSGNTMAVVSARVAPRAPATVARWNLAPLLEDFEDPGMDAYLGWLTLDRRSDNLAALTAAHPPKPGRFALTGLREDGYREYRRV